MDRRLNSVIELGCNELGARAIPRGWATATFSRDGAAYAFFSDSPYVPEAERSIDPARLGLGDLLAPRNQE